MIDHIKETIPGAVGYCSATAAFSLAWFTTNVLPILHILSVLVGIGASIATAIYYLRAARAKREQVVRRRSYRKAKKRA